MKNFISKICVLFCIMSVDYYMPLQAIDTQIYCAVIEEIVQDARRSGSIDITFVRNLDNNTRHQLQQALESSIISLQNQLLSQVQISLLKTVCIIAAGGAFASLGGYLYFYYTGMPHLNNWWFDSARYRNLQEAMIMHTLPDNLTIEDIKKIAALTELSINQSKQKFLQSLIGLGISIASHVSGITVAGYATEILQTNEERLFMIDNLQAALAELIENLV